MRRMPASMRLRRTAAILAALLCGGAEGPRSLDYYRLAPTFQQEVKNAAGFAAGTGFAHANRWGQYTAYLMTTNAQGERTWRIEDYLPFPGQGFAQGSTIYLLEGRRRALLIDTGQPAKSVAGVNDLKSVVRFLLGHDNRGRPKAHPLDFVVANTHNHPDHIGENGEMSDRTIYYPDLDWPQHAPPNYVPIREGGGATAHGSGSAVGEIDLGGRVLKAIAVPPHTPGSTAYLDAANHMLFSGDAIGSAWPFVQWGPFTTYDRSVHHLEEVTRGIPDLAVLPAHFYQIAAWGRTYGPLGRRYILDQVALADEILNGTAIGTPFPIGDTSMWARHGSAQAVYSLGALAKPGEGLAQPYHAIRLPGSFRQEWSNTSPNQDITRLDAIRSPIFLIREQRLGSFYLIKGAQAALLIGTGHGSPGLAPFIAHLVGPLPLDVLLLDNGKAQTGGLAQLNPRHVYAPAQGAPAGSTPIADGDSVTLGQEGRAGAKLVVTTMDLPGRHAVSLLDETDRALFIDDSLGGGAGQPPLEVVDPDAFQVALSRWWSHVVGRYDLLYPSDSAAWYNDPRRIDRLEQLLSQINQGKAVVSASSRMGWSVFTLAEPVPSDTRVIAPAAAE